MGMLLTRHYANRHNEGVAKAVAPSTSSTKVEEKKVEEPKFSVEDIKAMNGAKLRKFAKENGIEDPEDLTVGELKAILIEKLG